VSRSLIHEELMTSVLCVIVNFEDSMAGLYLPRYSMVNRERAIAYLTRLDPEVKHIEVYVETTLTAVYKRDGETWTNAK
jgi:hypothetical protein